jgi:hypothetical protein
MPFTIRATTSVPVLPRACNDAFSKSTNVKSSATYDTPSRDAATVRKRDAWRSDIDLRRYSALAAGREDDCPIINSESPDKEKGRLESRP